MDVWVGGLAVAGEWMVLCLRVGGLAVAGEWMACAVWRWSLLICFGVWRWEWMGLGYSRGQAV